MRNCNAFIILMLVLLSSDLMYGQASFEKRINCGGPSATYNGITFDADDLSSSPYSDGELKKLFNAIADPAKPYIKHIRYSKTPGSSAPHQMQYVIEVPQLDQYDVILHFKEVYFGVASSTGNGYDMRVFDVDVQGQQVANDMDLAEDYPNGEHTITTQVTSILDTNDNKYKITIDFEASANDPIINGIEILGVASGGGGTGNWTQSGSDVYFDGGKVGIGVSTPTNTLTVAGTDVNEPSLLIRNKSYNMGHSSGTASMRFGFADHLGPIIEASKVATNISVLKFYGEYGFNDKRLMMTMRPTSVGPRIGIGTDNPDATLTVNGRIHSTEVKVDMLGPLVPDYVFKKDYDLNSLKEVKEYIEENGHLPNIPSALEIEANGIDLGAMDMKLLEKIEELTLYILEQEQRINQLEKGQTKN